MNGPLLKTRLIPRTRRIERRHAQEAIAHLRSAGFRHIQVSAARDGRDCPICAAMDGAIFSVDAPPTIPPWNCRCPKPFGCRLVVTACRKKDVRPS